MDESMKIASEQACEYFSRGVVQGLNMIDHGLAIDTNKPLYPVSRHRSERIFSLNKLSEFFVEGERIDYTTGVERNQLEADSARELFRKFEASVTASGQVSGIATKVSATAKAEFKYEQSKKTNIKFAQIKLLCQVASVSLPEDEDLRALLDEKFKQRIDSISSLDEAINFVDRYGAIYIKDATWGGMLSLTTSSQITESSRDISLLTELKAEVKTIMSKGKVNASSSGEVNEEQNERNFRYTLVGLGGTPALVNDEELWMRSVGKRPALINIRVANIAELALPDSQAKTYLLEAVQRDVVEFEKEFGFDLVLKGYQHFIKDHFKNEEINQEAQNLVDEMKTGQQFTFKIDTREVAEQVQGHLKGNMAVQDFIVEFTRLTEALLKKYEDNAGLEIGQSTWQKILNLAQEAGNYGLSGSIASFYNDEHGRFLRIENGKLTTTNPTDLELLQEDNAEFIIRTVDKARGHVTIQCTETNNYMTVKNGDTEVSFKKGRPTNNDVRFSFFATKSAVCIKSVAAGTFVSIDPDSFEVKMVENVDDNATLIVQESA